MVKQRPKPVALFIRKVDEMQTETERWSLVRDLAGELEPLAIRQLQLEPEHLANLSFAQTVDVTSTFG